MTRAAAEDGGAMEAARWFDAGYYLRRHGDVAAAGVDPLGHYLHAGWREGRDPSAVFSTRIYLDLNPALAPQGICPLVHFASRALHLRPGSLARAEHAATEMRMLGRLPPHLLRLAGIAPDDDQRAGLLLRIFAADDWRIAAGLAPETSIPDALMHYLLNGLPQDQSPGPMFQPDHYRKALSDAGQPPASGPLLVDWLDRGIALQISPMPLFVSANYLAINPDAARFGGWVFDHWLRFGMDEGRQFHPTLHLESGPAGRPGPARQAVARQAVARLGGPGPQAELARMERFRTGEMSGIVAAAAVHDPDIRSVLPRHKSILPPWHDHGYRLLRDCLDLLPDRAFDIVVTMPCCRLGGADRVTGALCAALLQAGNRVLLLRTDQGDWARPDWFPAGLAAVDLSPVLGRASSSEATRAFYTLLGMIAPQAVFNVNSALMFATLDRFGPRLAVQMQVFCYYFCTERTPEGDENGWPITHFAPLLPGLTAALFDSAALARDLCRRFAVPPEAGARVKILRSPGSGPLPAEPLVIRQIAGREDRPRPRILWASRLDRQKRFDLVMEIARALPDWDFLCWGAALLETAPDLSGMPANVTLNPPFSDLSELPIADCDGWLYTAAWDGLPTLLIELARLGMPIVASAVGGVPELVDEATGWPVRGADDAAAYVDALQAMLSQDADRLSRATALQARYGARHLPERYAQAIAGLLAGKLP